MSGTRLGAMRGVDAEFTARTVKAARRPPTADRRPPTGGTGRRTSGAGSVRPGAGRSGAGGRRAVVVAEVGERVVHRHDGPLAQARRTQDLVLLRGEHLDRVPALDRLRIGPRLGPPVD